LVLSKKKRTDVLCQLCSANPDRADSPVKKNSTGLFSACLYTPKTFRIRSPVSTFAFPNFSSSSLDNDAFLFCRLSNVGPCVSGTSATEIEVKVEKIAMTRKFQLRFENGQRILRNLEIKSQLTYRNPTVASMYPEHRGPSDGPPKAMIESVKRGDGSGSGSSFARRESGADREKCRSLDSAAL